MDHTGNPPKDSQTDVDEEAGSTAAAQHHRDGRDEDCEQIEADIALRYLSVGVLVDEVMELNVLLTTSRLCALLGCFNYILLD